MKRLNPKHKSASSNQHANDSAILHAPDKIKTLKGLWRDNKKHIFRKIYQFLRRNRFWVRVCLSAACVIGFLGISSLSYKTGFHQGFEQWATLTGRLHQLKKQQEVFHHENLTLKKQLSSLEQQHTIREIEYQRLSAEIKDLLRANAELKEDNALYQHVMGKPHSKNGLAIQRLQIYATQSPNIFQYQLMLISNLPQKKLLKGGAQIAVSGKMGLKDLTLPMQGITSSADAASLGFKFKNYQELTGELLLPNGFEPKSVIVRVEPQNDGKLKSIQVFPWWLDSPQVG